MANGFFQTPIPRNEPVLSYGPGSPEKKEVKQKLAELKSQKIEIPLIIGGEEVQSGNPGECRCPHQHGHVLATYQQAESQEVEQAIQAAQDAWPKWAAMSWEARAAIFLKAADLLAGPFRATLNAATMLGQGKTIFQAEIDSACELIDFYRFNPYYMQQIYQQQPESARGCWNYLEQRPLEGFIFAVTPFNFTSIAGNLPTSPAMMGNTVVWKPASSAVYSAYFVMKLLQAAGLPDGVINFVPGSGGKVGTPALNSPELAGVHFTGSTAVFQGMWRTIGTNIQQYKSYPRIVGETGGKDFIFVHNSANMDETITAAIRGAFEYSGQKCSAASRIYLPESMWAEFETQALAMLKRLKMGDPEDFRNFTGPVIDRAAFTSITEYIEFAKASAEAEIVAGGKYDDSKGYFIEPTIVKTGNPHFKLIEEEIFGPVLTIYTYPDSDYEATLYLCNRTSPYALTGAIMATERAAIELARDILRHAAGNFYINDKPTGAVVGQQPFGGGRASGTNDKAGSMINLQRWISPRTIKETFVPPTDFIYPHMDEK